tara:strand:- start:23 stop:394 length:372 start_codon:yes stop_codon:yes gene_type:complete
MIKLKNILNEQGKAPLKAIGGNILYGNRMYTLKADTGKRFMPFVTIDVTDINQLNNGNIQMDYINPNPLAKQKDGESIIDDPNVIDTLRTDMQRGKPEIKIDKTVLPTEMQDLVNGLVLVRVK